LEPVEGDGLPSVTKGVTGFVTYPFRDIPVTT
jgi:hypothetical protein